jgi:RNA polymerase sigma factor (sigma-70 family)
MMAGAVTMSEQDQLITEAVTRERPRLRNFVRRWGLAEADVEDILQDVFYEIVEAYRLMKPIEQAGAWMLRVARNRIIDRFRKKKYQPADPSAGLANEDGERLDLEDWLPSPDAGPEDAYTRTVLLEELEDALAELPEEQRAVFIANEIEGRSFKELSAETGVSVNTLLSRKRYAVLHLRERLREFYDDM